MRKKPPQSVNLDAPHITDVYRLEYKFYIERKSYLTSIAHTVYFLLLFSTNDSETIKSSIYILRAIKSVTGLHEKNSEIVIISLLYARFG